MTGSCIIEWCYPSGLSLGLCFSHLFQVDALAGGVWPGDYFDSAMWIGALVTVGHKHRGAELQQRMPGTLEHWWIDAAQGFCIQGLLDRRSAINQTQDLFTFPLHLWITSATFRLQEVVRRALSSFTVWAPPTCPEWLIFPCGRTVWVMCSHTPERHRS